MRGAVSTRDRVREKLAELKLPGSLEVVDEVLSRVDGGALGVAEAIEELLDAQIELRIQRRLETASRSTRLPHLKSLDDFDFSLQPSVERTRMSSLHELGFLRRRENVVFCGPPGVGKTHLATSLGVAAIKSGCSVYFATLLEIVESMRQAQEEGTLRRRLGILTRPKLLIVDEIGYLPLSEDGGRLLFQLVSARHERASTVLTTNKGFEEWGSVLGDEVMATAMLDRLLHHCHVVNIQGSSYRMRAFRAKRKELVEKQKIEEKNFQGLAPEVDRSVTF